MSTIGSPLIDCADRRRAIADSRVLRVTPHVNAIPYRKNALRWRRAEST